MKCSLQNFCKSSGAEAVAVGRISHVAVVFHGNNAIDTTAAAKSDATVAVGLPDTLPPTLFPASF